METFGTFDEAGYEFDHEEIDDLYKKNENQRKELASLNNKFRQ